MPSYITQPFIYLDLVKFGPTYMHGLTSRQVLWCFISTSLAMEVASVCFHFSLSLLWPTLPYPFEEVPCHMWARMSHADRSIATIPACVDLGVTPLGSLDD